MYEIESHNNDDHENDGSLGHYEWPEQENAQFEKQALSEPTFDFYESVNFFTPKQAIGEYVESQGFHVPLIHNQAEWEDAFDNNQAMLRSELPQDYKGLSGLYSSLPISKKFFESLSPYDETQPEFREKLNNLLFDGLRNSEIAPTDYMSTFVWPNERESLMHAMYRLGISGIEHLYAPEASRWRYTPGANLTVFKDTAIEDRYHVKSFSNKDSYVMGWRFDGVSDNDKISFDRGDLSVPVRQMVDFYEQIRALPRFDVSHYRGVGTLNMSNRFSQQVIECNQL